MLALQLLLNRILKKTQKRRNQHIKDSITYWTTVWPPFSVKQELSRSKSPQCITPAFYIIAREKETKPNQTNN